MPWEELKSVSTLTQYKVRECSSQKIIQKKKKPLRDKQKGGARSGHNDKPGSLSESMFELGNINKSQVLVCLDILDILKKCYSLGLQVLTVVRKVDRVRNWKERPLGMTWEKSSWLGFNPLRVCKHNH